MFGIGQSEFTVLVVYVIFALATGALAHRKGRSAIGWGILAFVLTPLVLIILLCLSSLETAKARTMRELDAADYRDCPYCAEPIRREASVCKHCGKDVEPKASIPKMACPRCGYQTPATGRPCVHCGAELR